jgi:hypothetical protein
MAKAKVEAPSRSSVFTRYFTEDKDLLRQPGFDKIAEMYKADFPDRPFSDKERQIAANIKSKLRKEYKIRRRRRRGRAAAAATGGSVGGAAPRLTRGIGSLHQLEAQIDDCLVQARRLGREDLEDVVKHLHRARNLVIVRLGE